MGQKKTKTDNAVKIAVVTTAGSVLVALITALLAPGILKSLDATLASNQVAIITHQSPTNTGIAPSATVFSSQTPPTRDITLPAESYQILVDARHDSPGTFEALRAANVEGFIFTKSDRSEFTLDSLSKYDAIIISFAWYPTDPPQVERFTPSEIRAIRDYIDQGGRVFLIGLAWVWKAYKQGTIEDYPLNLISIPYGITFNTDSYACPRNAEQVIEIGSALMDTQHFIVKDLRLIASKAGSAISDLIVTAPADVIASCAKTSPILASVQVGKGRVIALVGRTFINDNLDTNTFNNYELLKNWSLANFQKHREIRGSRSPDFPEESRNLPMSSKEHPDMACRRIVSM